MVGIIYRPPNQNVQSFLDYLSYIFSIVNKGKKCLYLLGDFNLDLLELMSCQNVVNFLDLCMTNSVYPLIHSPTRVTNTSATLLDNIFTNDLEQSHAGVMIADISDHFPVFSLSNYTVNNEKDPHVIYRRKINDSNCAQFVNEIRNMSWTVNSGNSDYAYNWFLIHSCVFIINVSRWKQCHAKKV